MDKVPVRHTRGEGIQDKRDGVISVDTLTYKMYIGDGTVANPIVADAEKEQIVSQLGDDTYVPQAKVKTITPEEIDIICSI